MEDGKGSLSPGQLHSDVTKVSAKTKLKNNKSQIFDFDEPITVTLDNSEIEYEICPSKDVNSAEVIERLKARPEKYFVYSGVGGAILRKDILCLGKMFLHIHPGIVPDYKGSTTIYYSILEEDNCGASAFFLDENIDTGALIRMKEFAKPIDGEIIDYIYDPYIRSDLLLEVIREYVNKGKFIQEQQKAEAGETYFIIHPVLKHIAILSCNDET